MARRSCSRRWRNAALVVAAGAALAACGGTTQDQAGSTSPAANVGSSDLTAVPREPAMLGITWTREEHDRRVAEEMAADAAKAAQGAKRSPNMTYHGGKILTQVVTKAIFWGTSWPAYSGDKITGTDSWYTGFSNSTYSKTSDEYTDTVTGGHQVGPTTTHQGHVIDGSASSGGSSTSAILAEVCKVVTSPDPSGNGYYAVYTDLPRGNANYCAWHSAGSCGGVPVQFAFFWNLDGDPGCDPQDPSGLHSQGLAALANVSGHELSEARTDPASPGAWYDSRGAENGDKCAWTFGAPLVTFSNGTQWKIQGEWSNAAYTAGTGYPNSAGQDGCLSGL